MDIEAWWVWMILAALFVIAEIFTAGFFLLWFGVGAAVAGVLDILGLGAGWQWASFLIISIVLFAISRKFADKLTKEQPPGIGADRFIGKQGIVLEIIDSAKNTGRVRIDTDEWRALGEGEEIIPEGTKVEVIRVEGTRLVVNPIKEED